MLTGGDAPADTSTKLCFNPPNGPFGDDNVVTGTIGRVGDEDWIIIELSEGKEYTITVGGDTGSGRLNDSVLKLMNGKGDLIAMNDDKDGARRMLGSELIFTPEAGSGTQVYYISVSGYTDNPAATNTGGYTISVKEMAMRVGEGAYIEATSNDAHKLFGTVNDDSIAGLGGNDILEGGAGDDTLEGGAGNDLLVGGAGADTLVGGAGKDTISYRNSMEGVTINLNLGTARGGDAKGDILGRGIENVIGSMHDDMLTGTDYANSLWGLAGDDTLYGGEGDDTLYGGEGDDTLDGGDNNDTLTGGAGADVLIGGGGEDTASWAGSMMGVTVRLHANQAMGGDAEGDVFADLTTVEYSMPAADPEDPPVAMTETVPDIVHLIGSAQADTLAGDSRSNTIKGGGGNDSIFGGPGGGHDTLDGGDGNDSVFGGKGNDILRGGKGNDVLSGGPGADEFQGGAGNDMIYADLMDLEYIDGGEGTDTVSFERLVDKAIGTSAEPYTLGGRNAAGIERAIGTDDDDYITGEDNSPNQIEGRDGADTLVGGAGGGDTVSYESSDRRVRVDLGDGTSDGSNNSGGHATGDNISGFENVKGSAFGDVLTARSNDTDEGTDGQQGSTLWGLGGDDSLVGGGGNDTIEGGAGADELDGGYTPTAADGSAGEASDRGNMNYQKNALSYAGSDAGVTVNLATVTVSGGHAEGDDIETYEFLDDKGTADNTSDDVEIDVATFVNVTGSMHKDRLIGDRFGNHLVGGDGNDTLHGGAGADVLEGSKGADSLDGGQDRGDTQSEDWAVYRGAAESVMVNLDTGNGTGGEAMGDTLKDIELVWGSKHNDTFVASEGVDIIHGDGGSDTVSYEASDDGVTVVLNNGQYGDDPNTTDTETDVFFSPADATVAAWMPGAASPATRPDPVQRDDGLDTTKSYAEGDILASIENVTGSRGNDTIRGDGAPNVIKGGAGNDTLSGAGQNDKLHGGAGNDKLYGGAGNDTLVGGAGDDDLGGGAGNDTFVFKPGNGFDVIVSADDGFSATEDKIDLRAFDIEAADLLGLIRVRGGNTLIDLRDHGGRTIIIQDVTDLDSFEKTGSDADNNKIDNADALSVWTDTNENGVVDSGEAGLFIL